MRIQAKNFIKKADARTQLNIVNMDMNWYRTAEHAINQQDWPVSLKPVLRESGLKFETENLLPPVGVLIIPSNWKANPAHENLVDSMVFRSKNAFEVPNMALQNAVTTVDMPVLRPRPVPVTQRVFVYNPSSGQRPYSLVATTEPNIKRFTSLVLGALPHGVTLFKHVPNKRLYIYIADDIWQWEGNIDVGLAIIAATVQQHVANGILLCWNRDLRRYLVMVIQPNQCVLDWEADFDKPNITQLFDEISVDRILGYNSYTSLVFTMTIAAARIAVQIDASVH